MFYMAWVIDAENDPNKVSGVSIASDGKPSHGFGHESYVKVRQ